jgi:hypothetical protein
MDPKEILESVINLGLLTRIHIGHPLSSAFRKNSTSTLRNPRVSEDANDATYELLRKIRRTDNFSVKCTDTLRRQKISRIFPPVISN